MAHYNTPISTWETTVEQPVLHGIVNELLDKKLLPVADKYLLKDKEVFVKHEGADVNPDTNIRRTTGSSTVTVTHDVQKRIKGARGIRAPLYEEAPFLNDPDSGVSVTALNNNYKIIFEIRYEDPNYGVVRKYVNHLSQVMHHHHAEVQHSLNYGFVLDDDITNFLKEVAGCRISLFNELIVTKDKRIAEIEALTTPGDAETTELQYLLTINDPEQLTYEAYLNFISSGKITIASDDTSTLNTVYIPRRQLGVFGRFTSSDFDVLKESDGSFYCDVIYEVELSLPDTLMLHYPLTYYNQVPSDNYLPVVIPPPIGDKKQIDSLLMKATQFIDFKSNFYIKAQASNTDYMHRDELDPHLYEAVANRTFIDTPLVFPDFDLESTPPHDVDMACIMTVLTTLATDGSRLLFNLNDIPNGWIDRKVLDWLIRYEHDYVTTNYESIFQVMLSINNQVSHHDLYVDDDLNVYLKDDLSHLNTYRVLLYVRRDPITITNEAMWRLMADPYVFALMINTWRNIDSINDNQQEYFLNLCGSTQYTLEDVLNPISDFRRYWTTGILGAFPQSVSHGLRHQSRHPIATELRHRHTGSTLIPWDLSKINTLRSGNVFVTKLISKKQVK